MKLALNKQLFHDTIRASSQYLKIREEFIEKVYKAEISALAFTEIPPVENILEVFKNIFNTLWKNKQCTKKP